MKIFSLLVCAILLVVWSCNSGSALQNDPQARSRKADSLMKMLPAYVDTSVVVKDNNGHSLKFRQYILTLFQNEGMLYREKDDWRLQRFTKTSMDSLERDDYAIARWDRWAAKRNPNPPKTTEEKFRAIAETLSMADHILVLKSERLMIVSRKSISLFRFAIDLGRNPVGDKQQEGDWRTPEGVYYIDNKMERRDKYYKSFWISYPDSADRAKADKLHVAPGVGVQIHGTTPQSTNAKDWTNGCIALSNRDMDSLFKHVVSGTTIEIRK